MLLKQLLTSRSPPMVNEGIKPAITRTIEIFEHLEREIPDLSVRMTTHIFFRLIVKCDSEINKAKEEDVCKTTVEVFCEMKKMMQSLGSCSHAGRICKTIFEAMQTADANALQSCLERGDMENLIQILLDVYESVKAGFLALAQDGAFFACLGSNGKNRLIELASVVQNIIDNASYDDYPTTPLIFQKQTFS